MSVGCIKIYTGIALLLAVWTGGLAQDSLGMRRVSALSYWQGAYDLQMVGNLAYIVGGSSGLHITDLTDPARPTELGRYTWFPRDVGGRVYVSGNRAYVALPIGGTVLDVTNPANPVTLGQWEGNWADVTLVHGNWAIAGYAEGYARVLDVSNPANVRVIGNFPDQYYPSDALGMAGEYLVMQHFPGGIRLYDMSNPAVPVLVATCDTMSSRSRYGTISGNCAYLATFMDGLHIIDLSDPLQPTLVAVCDTNCYDVTVLGNYAVTSSSIMLLSGLRVWNIANPAQPILEGTLLAPPESNGFGRVSGSGHLVCVENWGLKKAKFVDISNPSAPTIVSETGDYGILRHFALRGAVAYIADAQVGLHTVNIEDPNHVSELGNMYHHSSGTSNPALYADYAYLSVASHGVFVVDVSNPAQPESVRTVMPTAIRNIVRVMVVGDYLYAIDTGASGSPSLLQVFSLADPANPQWVDSVAIRRLNVWETFGTMVDNGYLYFAQDRYFDVISLVNPAAPQVLGSFILPVCDTCYVTSLAGAGDHVYVAYEHGGILILSMACPGAEPTVVGQTGDFARAVAAAESIIAVDELHRISIMDLTDPVRPSVIGYYPTDERIVDMQIVGNCLFTTSKSEFRVYQIDALTSAEEHRDVIPHEFVLYPCYPNPFNPVTTIRYDVRQTGHLRLTIFNLLGQEVTRLVDKHHKPGSYTISWNAADLPSGIYLCRMEAQGFAMTRKIVLVK